MQSTSQSILQLSSRISYREALLANRTNPESMSVRNASEGIMREYWLLIEKARPCRLGKCRIFFQRILVHRLACQSIKFCHLCVKYSTVSIVTICNILGELQWKHYAGNRILHTGELSVGLIEHANCFVEGTFRNSSAVFLGQCDVWALLLHQDASFSAREGTFTIPVGEGVRSCAATEYKLEANSVEINASRIVLQGRTDRALRVFKTCYQGEVRDDEVSMDSNKSAVTHAGVLATNSIPH